jgi:Cu2+-exporting ATPase
LIKGGRCLEQLAEVDALVFDKTGTLTMGALRVTDILPQVGGVCDNDILALAAAAEQRLTHPVADAVLRTAQMRGLDIPERSDSVYSIGLGVEATVDGLPVLVGSPRFMASKKVSFAPGARRDVERIASCGASPLCLAVDGNLSGIISLADSPRGEAAQVLHALRHDGIRKVVLLTGDQEAAAADMARTLGITDYVSEVFPEEKVEAVRRLKRQGYRVGVVGDGINDSPALVEGHVGIAVGWGTEVARETAQVVLVRGDLWQLPMAIRIAREAMGLVQGGWRIIWTLNSLALSLTFMGAIGPLLAATISNGSSVLAAMNGLRPLLNGHDAGGYSGNGARSVRQGP